MGAVYLARDVHLERPVALKVLPPEFAVRPALRDRFLRETRTAASFSHPNVVPVYAVEDRDDLLAYAMAYVEGESLAERVKRAGPLSVRETVRLLQDVGYALAYAHGRGVVHRDIKPDNIMIERATGRALVMDFGIARVIEASLDGGEGLTRMGEVVGTPEYMSPEQAAADHVDGRSDLYSLGLTVYFALTGTVAMRGESVGKVLAKQLTEPVPALRTVRGDLPASLAEAIDRCVAKEPDARFQTAEALVEAIDATQLSAPEVPLVVRLFTQELSAVSMVVALSAMFCAVLVWELADYDYSAIDLFIPVFLIFTIVFTRFLQTVSEARRLALAGFGPADVQRGLIAVMSERDIRRAELATDERTRRARRRTIRWAVGQLIAAAVFFRAALLFHHQVGPAQYANEPPGIFLFLSAQLLFGTGVVLLLRSPIHIGVGERLFRLVWLGPFGRWFFRLATGGQSRRAAAGPVAIVTAAPAPAAASSGRDVVKATAVAVPAERVAVLESRIEELERWRARSESR